MLGRKRKWYQLDSRGLSNLVVVCAGVLLYLGVTHLAQVQVAWRTVMKVMKPFISGFIIAFLLHTPVNFFQKKVFKNRKNSDVLSITAVYIIAFVALAILLQLVLPSLAESIASLFDNLSTYLDNLSAMAQSIISHLHIQGEGLIDFISDYQSLVKRLAQLLRSSVPNLLNFGMAVGNGVINAITSVIASIYMLAEKETLLRQLRKMIYAVFSVKESNQILMVARRSNRIFAGFIYGKLLDSAIIGVLCFILCTILRIPYAVLVSVIVGITNVIPFFGPFIGAIPSGLILLMVRPWAAVRFVVMILALQQFDGNILGPKILGNSTGLSALWVLVSIVVGGGLFGFMGMLLGVPTVAVIYTLIRDWSNRKLYEKGIDGNGNPIDRCAVPQHEPPIES